MTPDVETVRSTRTPVQMGKNHLLIVAVAAALLIVIVAAVWLMARPTALYPVRMNGKYAYINKSGKLVIQPQFDRAEPFTEGYAAVQTAGRWGFIDKTGKLTIAPQYDLADPYSEGLALVGV